MVEYILGKTAKTSMPVSRSCALSLVSLVYVVADTVSIPHVAHHAPVSWLRTLSLPRAVGRGGGSGGQAAKEEEGDSAGGRVGHPARLRRLRGGRSDGGADVYAGGEGVCVCERVNVCGYVCVGL